MDYLDTFEVDSTNKKCHRVRSWYLYEQYKSLERNQLDAAKLLKSKSYQNNILRQELKERRARRRLCDEYGLCQSKSAIDRSIRSCPSATDDLFESLCELHEEHEENEETCSFDCTQTSKNNDDITSLCTGYRIENKIDDFSDTESIQSVIDNFTLGNLDLNVKQELEIVKKKIAENINLQLETVKENIECLEKVNHNKEDVLFPQNDKDELNYTKKVKKKTKNIFDSLFLMWSNLVVFAHNSIQPNHGNCYWQCSSQILTAVLACDFLRKGVDNMCHILQSYVSPIKYVTSESESSFTPNDQICDDRRKKKKKNEKSSRILSDCKHCSCNRLNKSKTFDRRCCSEKRYKSNYSSENRMNEEIYRGASETWRSRKYCSNNNILKDKLSNEKLCNCHYLKDIVNPILQVARYIENISQEVEETPVLI